MLDIFRSNPVNPVPENSATPEDSAMSDGAAVVKRVGLGRNLSRKAVLLLLGALAIGCNDQNKNAHSRPNTDTTEAPKVGSVDSGKLNNEPKKIEQVKEEVPIYEFDEARVTKPWLWLLTEARQKGWKGRMSGSKSGLRSYDEQKSLYVKFLHGGNPASNPDGKSLNMRQHMLRELQKHPLDPWRMAIDTESAHVPELIRIAEELGVILYQPYNNDKHELHHVEAFKPFDAPAGWIPDQKSIKNPEPSYIVKQKVVDNDDASATHVKIDANADEKLPLAVLQDVARAQQFLKDKKIPYKVDEQDKITEYHIGLAVKNKKNPQIEFILLPPGESAVKGFQIKKGKANGVNTSMTITKPTDYVVLAIKRPLSARGKGISQVIYSPYGQEFDTPEIRKQGFEYLKNVVEKAKNRLAENNVKSQAARGKKVVDVVPVDLAPVLVAIEHIEYYKLKKGVPIADLVGEVMVNMALNRENTYDYAISRGAGARGMFQITEDTYDRFDDHYPDAKLNPDFVEGVNDHVNAAEVALLHFDNGLAILRPADFKKWLLEQDPKIVARFLAAEYNAGVVKNMPKVVSGPEYDRWLKSLRPETQGYVEKFDGAWDFMKKGL